jgi:hypothetical protein
MKATPATYGPLRAAAFGGLALGALSLLTALLFSDQQAAPSAALLHALGRAVPLMGEEQAYFLVVHTALFGGALVAAALALLLYAAPAAEPQRQARRITLISFCFILCLWGGLSALSHTDLINGVRFWWLADDQMISMRYARSLVEGQGLVWNPGERVEGFSNPLWVMVMVLVHLLPLGTPVISTAMLALSVLLGALSALPLSRLVAQLGGGPTAQLGALAWYSVSASCSLVIMYGWEHALLVPLCLLALCRVIDEVRVGSAQLSTCLLLGLISLVRVDAALISAVLGCGLLLWIPQRGRTLLLLGCGVLIPLAYELFRLDYYGEWWPNTYYLKVTGWDRLHAGNAALHSIAREYGLALLAMLIGVALLPRKEALLVGGLVAAHIAYTWWTGGDFGPGSRKYMIPILALLFAIAAVTAEKLAIWMRLPPTLGWLLVIPMMACTSLLLPGPMSKTLMLTRDGEFSNVVIGNHFLGMPPGTKVSDGGAGQIFYFGKTLGIDYLGVTDKFIARTPAAAPHAFAGHNKFDFNYSIGKLHPDYVVSSLLRTVEPTPQLIEERSKGDWPMVGGLFKNRDFASYCFPNPMPWPDTARVVYHCRWPQALPESPLQPPGG